MNGVSELETRLTVIIKGQGSAKTGCHKAENKNACGSTLFYFEKWA